MSRRRKRVQRAARRRESTPVAPDAIAPSSCCPRAAQPHSADCLVGRILGPRASWAAAAPPINEDAQRLVDDVMARSLPQETSKRTLTVDGGCPRMVRDDGTYDLDCPMNSEPTPLTNEQRDRIRQFREEYQKIRSDRAAWAAVWAEPETGGEG